MRQLMNMNALQDFISVITHGSFSAASRATMTPKASISRRIRQLEDELQTRLFERTNTGFTLTAEGTLLFERIKPLVNELNDIKTDMMEQTGSPSGKLRISVPPVIAFDTLGKLAARYRELYPLVELELIADSRLVDPIREGFDAVIRVNPMADEEMQPLMAEYHLTLEQAYQRVCRDVPLRRPASAEEIAAICRFLCSEDASIITGAALVADGGSTIVDVPTLAFTSL